MSGQRLRFRNQKHQYLLLWCLRSVSVRTKFKKNARTETASGGFGTESRITCAKQTTSLLLLWLLLRLCGTETASAEAGRLLWLSLTKRAKPGPGLLLLLLRLLLLLLLLTECTEPCSGGGTSGTSSSKSTSTTTESRLSRLCCGLGLAKQPSRCRRLCCRAKRTRTKSPRGGCLTILLVVLQPEFLRRAKSVGE